eukprot:9503873-Pyramimonas_sp.AAC.2
MQLVHGGSPKCAHFKLRHEAHVSVVVCFDQHGAHANALTGGENGGAGAGETHTGKLPPNVIGLGSW